MFHDNTALSLPKLSNAYLQRIIYSSYYAGNVRKRGVFAHLCGQLGTFELYPGAISDTDYLNKTGILEMQKYFT